MPYIPHIRQYSVPYALSSLFQSSRRHLRRTSSSSSTVSYNDDDSLDYSVGSVRTDAAFDFEDELEVDVALVWTGGVGEEEEENERGGNPTISIENVSISYDGTCSLNFYLHCA